MPNSLEANSEYLFVYGTLRHALESKAHKEYLRAADFVSPAKIRGKLFMVDYYPGLVLSDADHWAQGEIYLLGYEGQLHDLDVYEGCAKQSPQPHEYERKLVEVHLTNGETMEAWVYVYIRDVSESPWISNGDFLNPHLVPIDAVE